MPGVEKDTDVDEDMNTDYFKYTLHVHNTNFLYQTFLQPHSLPDSGFNIITTLISTGV